MFRVGIGQDSHRFSLEEKPLVLGGVVIDDHKGLEADSDGDVILHSLFNAISQSIGGRSIGEYATDMCKNGIKDSSEYIKVVMEMLKDEGYRLNNVGIMIEAKSPKIEPYVDEMKKMIGKMISCKDKDISITATSGEGLTSFGRGEGIQVHTIVSIVRKEIDEWKE